MTNEARATIERPRTPSQIEAELLSARADRAAAMKIIGEIAAFDVSPIVFVAGELLPLREIEIPENVRAYYHETAIRVAQLERELYDATAPYRPSEPIHMPVSVPRPAPSA